MIRNTLETKRAWLAWQEPLHTGGRRDRLRVAELEDQQAKVSFRYLVGEEEFQRAQSARFRGYPGLPLGSNSLDGVALSVLMRRLPSRSRGDFNSILNSFGLSAERPYTDLSLLAFTGARLTRDSFSVCETFDGFEPPFRYVFDVAGYRHHREQTLSLEENEILHFEREPDNEHDPDAVRIVRSDGNRVGYVNRLQSPVVGRWLDNNGINAKVVRINGRPVYPRLFVEAEILPERATKAA